MSAGARALFVAPAAYPLGGVQVWLDYLLPGLRTHGWQPVLGLVAGPLHDVERYVAVHPGHELVAIPNPTGSVEGRARALMATIRELRPDILVCVNIVDCYEAVARLRAAGIAAPRIVMADHSLERDFLTDAATWKHTLDGFIGTNQLTCELARQVSGLAAERIQYAQYGVPLLALRPATQTLDRPLRIAYSGRLDQAQKRAQDLPAILRRLDDTGVAYEFRLAGGGPYLPTLTRELGPAIDRGVVKLLGVLDSKTLQADLYDWADVLLVTSFWETGPIVIWEAMASGLAVVSSHYVGSGLEAALVHDTNALLYPVGDCDAAAACLARMRDASLRASLTQEAHRLIDARYSREKSIAAWDRCLRNILALPPLGAAARMLPPPPATGRLDALLGAGAAESVRRLLGRSFAHAEPGGEWPHTGRQPTASEDSAHWEDARRVDTQEEIAP
ncbi:glycosyltransferase [Caenimonas koreensis DSM 17982]|uniref:Glycosyltransferase n=1 Tax=Caenimonas koreensis DSM 17982 TaxID=1121255 RepID=A0A844AR73_9BURK|nr:glycosyltransferase family 4 protein [Caenimonas koreensis]MRD46830.1 glycosyltransferase [Caenimonas koreensis DSM 17982]